MEENYMISVIGTQIVDGEKETINLKTLGDYRIQKDSIYIRYKEYDNDNPDICYSNTVKVSGDTVTVIRGGAANSRLVLEKGRRHQCHYSTFFGNIMVGVYADTVQSNLDEHGGTLRASYSLDFNAGLVSKNEIYIKVTEKEVN